MPEQTALQKLWGFTKQYVKDVVSTYVIFIGPLMLIAVTSSVISDQDKEYFGLGWLHLTSLENDRVREEKFPSYEPSTALQRRRAEAAKAVDYVAESV